MQYAVGALLLKTMGPELIIKSASVITNSAVNICGLFTHIYSHPNSASIISELKTLDLDVKIKVMDSLVKNIKPGTHSEPLSLCLKSLEDCLSDIEKCLKQIDEHLRYNSSLYLFPSWRSYNISSDVLSLKEMNSMLENRKNLLFDILKVEQT